MTKITKEMLKFFASEQAASLLAKLRELLQQRSIDCYIVGGFVRDGLMGRTSSDIDVAVDSDATLTATEVAKAFGAHGERVEKPAELAGQRVNGGGEILQIFAERLGMKTVTMVQSDFYTSLERGVVDGIINPVEFFNSIKELL